MGDKLRNPLHSDGWYVFDLFGEPAYADIGMCLIGKPPSKKVEVVKPDGQKLARHIAKKSQVLKAVIKTGSSHVRFVGLDMPIDARYYYHVLSQYPEATFHVPQKGDASRNPIPIKNAGKIVGAVMCLRV